jgi:hypothetical protein
MHHGITHRAVISKLRLGTAMTTDLVFVTKHSLITRIVLIELEGPDVNLLTNANGRVQATAKLTGGLAQLEEWKIYIDGHKNAVYETLEPFIYTDTIEFRYALVIGRSAEAHGSSERRKYLASLLQGRSDIDMLSYDSLIRGFRFHRRDPKNILSQQKNSWAFKSLVFPVPDAVPYNKRLDEYVIQLTNEQQAVLKKFGFDPEHMKGKPTPPETPARNYADDQLVRRLKEDGAL